MKKLDDKGIKRVLLNMMVDFRDVCEKNHLNYSLAGGTLLGAVRHHGFIPWDDDVDFCMARPDYEKFIQLYKQNKFPPYIKLLEKSVNGFKYPFMRWIDKRTKVNTKYLNDEQTTGIWIDIMPVDGITTDIQIQKKIYKKAHMYQKLVVLNLAKSKKGTSVIKKIIKTITLPLIKFGGKDNFYCKCLEKLAKNKSYENSDYVGCIVWGLYGTGEIMKKSEYERRIEILFEGKTFKIMSCYHTYLSNLYGNYLELPPKSKRINHTFDAWEK